ncbi:SCO7613 C-terminal domain-containing membrane protein [Geodermatophilus sp. SYSU D00708]
MGSAPVPPLPYRARPPLVFLVVGAALLVSGGGTAAAVFGPGPARVLLLGLAGAAAAASAWGSVHLLRSTEEVLAVAAVVLAVLGASAAGAPVFSGSVVPLLVLAGVFLALAWLLRRPATWPLASWAAVQLAVLRALQDTESEWARTAAALGVALGGLLVVLGGRRLVARIALVSTAPWWVAGVFGGIVTAWSGSAGERWGAAGLTAAAAAALLVARLERDLDPLLGRPVTVPVLSGVVVGAAVGGPLAFPGPAGVMLAGYTGVLVASVAAALLTGWPRGVLLPLAVAIGGTLVLFSVVQLIAGARWTELSLLLLLTAVPSALVAVRRRDERAAAAPTTVGCLAGAAVFAIAAGALSSAAAAALLSGLYAISLVAGYFLDTDSRQATLVAGAVCAAGAVVLLVGSRDRVVLAVLLAVQGVLTCAWAWHAWRTAVPRVDPPESSRAWRAGAAQLVVAAWTAVALADVSVVEAYTLPLAAGLLLAAGPRLTSGPSWPVWGPALLTAAVPSVVWSAVVPNNPRPVAVVVVAALVMLGGVHLGARAPLVAGATTELAMAGLLGLIALPWPVSAALVVGAALAALGAWREWLPVDGWTRRLAEMR